MVCVAEREKGRCRCGLVRDNRLDKMFNLSGSVPARLHAYPACPRGGMHASQHCSLRAVPCAGLRGVLGEVGKLDADGQRGQRSPRRRRGQGRGSQFGDGEIDDPVAKVHPLEAFRPGETRLIIQEYPARCLRAVNHDVKFDGGKAEEDKLRALAREMFEVMYATQGVGLAAPQVGINVRLLVYNPEGFPDRGEEFVLCNPRIVGRGRRTDRMEEGCLSFPEVYGDVERACEVDVEARDVEGNEVQLRLQGWQARVFQHEFDHLDGLLFHDRMDVQVRAKVQPRLDALVASYVGEGDPAL